jgi:hypothetical protein
MTERNEVLRSLFPDDDVSSIEGEFVEDVPPPDDPRLFEFDDEAFQFINCGPEKVARLLESGDPKLNREALLIAKRFWDERSGGFEVGEPFRGEPVKAQHIRKLSEVVGQYSSDQPFVRGSLSKDRSSKPNAESGEAGLIDFDILTGGADHEDQGPVEGCT